MEFVKNFRKNPEKTKKINRKTEKLKFQIKNDV